MLPSTLGVPDKDNGDHLLKNEHSHPAAQLLEAADSRIQPERPEDEEHLVRGKIRVLLLLDQQQQQQQSESSQHYYYERQLVALTLLTRIQGAGLLGLEHTDPTDNPVVGENNTVVSIWNDDDDGDSTGAGERPGALLQFALRLLQLPWTSDDCCSDGKKKDPVSSEEENESPVVLAHSTSNMIYARLVAQILYRMAADVPAAAAATTPELPLPNQPYIRNTLGEALLQCLKMNATTTEVSSVVQCEIIHSLNAWLDHAMDPEYLDQILQQIWHSSQTVRMGDARTTTTSTSSTTNEPDHVQSKRTCSGPWFGSSGATTSSSASSQQQQPPQILMNQTLTALLDQTSLVAVDGCEESTFEDPVNTASMSPWELQLELSQIWLRHGVRVMTLQCPTKPKNSQALPWIWRPLLSQWWLLQKPSRSTVTKNPITEGMLRVRQTQAHAILLLLQTHCVQQQQQQQSQQDKDDPMVTTTPQQQLLWNNPDVAEDVTRLILSCVVSTSGHRADALRMQAWMTAVALVRQAGYWWLGSSRVEPRGKPLPLLVRLAAGEWKIQLAAFLNQMEDKDKSLLPVSSMKTRPTPIRVSNDNDEQVLLIEVCAQFLLSIVNYLMQLSDDLDDDNHEKSRLNIPSGDVIRHVRQSLNEALTVSVQYLGEVASRKGANATVDSAVIRLLAKLLMEFDVFAPAEPRDRNRCMPMADQAGDDRGECATLQALRVAMEIAMMTSRKEDGEKSNDAEENDGADLMDCLLPSIAAVMASAEGESSRMDLLKDYGLLGNDSILYQFLLSFWTWSANDATSVSWACQVTELWMSMERIVSDTSRLQSAMVQYLQRQLNVAKSSSELSDCTEVEGALSAAVGCYVTLRADKEPPGEPDATVLQQVLAFCARHEYDEIFDDVAEFHAM